MTKYNTVNILSPSPLMYDFFFGTTYIGFDEMKEEYEKKYGEVGANMQVIHKKSNKKDLTNKL